MNPLRAIHSVVALPLHHFDDRTFAHVFHPQHLGLVDPFIGVDVFNMPHHFFLPHPHGGMSAITYLLPDSPGGVRNRDSLGDDSTIAPGDLHWLQAGSGMVHEETPATPGIPALGLQIFVNMAAAHKQVAPAVFQVAGADMPVVQQAGATVRVVAGEWGGRASPIASDPRWATRVTLLDVTLQPDADVRLPLPAGHQGFALVVAGHVLNQKHASAHDLKAPAAIVFDSGAVAPDAGDGPLHDVHLQAGPQGAQVVVFAGKPLREPVVPWGPFVGTSRAEVAAYAQAYQSGAMGQLDASFTRGA
ncbi:MAG TPA: pirin-like C-terminal cupin domain-containing protein [Burkholderiaceae bacterium]|nr:pirin-like C-terminal cupin domain-containing protein [Burkholderiaceae bacterium]